jgi:predicted short-subunit dehydrogenase-like oxidoreductase (DUF2520 family)
LSENKHKQFQITIVGSGNVAWHLARAFVFHGKHQVNTIIARNPTDGKKIAKESGAIYTHDFDTDTSTSDFVILALNDSCLAEVIAKMRSENTILLHTSGSVGMNVFKGKVQDYGVLYPFQTLTKGVKTDFCKIPVCIEASDEDVYSRLNALATSLSNKVYRFDSHKRRILHLSGIISNNFINHLINLAFIYLDKNNIDKDLLLPLLNETLAKLEKTSPVKAQTGPARRKNTEIIETHKKMLENEPELKNLYSLISDSIIAYYS